MHVRLIRRYFPPGWAYLSRIALAALVVEGLLILCVQTAFAQTQVAYLAVERSSGYVASRVYAGRAVAGRASELGFKQGGEVAQMSADIGDRVAAGDLLARLDTASLDAALAQAKADVSLAAANLMAIEAETELSRQTEARFRSLRESGHASEQVYDEQRLALRAKEAQLSVARANLQRADAARNAADILLREAHIHAPFAGTIQARHLDEGSQTAPGQPVLRLVETDHKEAHVGIPENLAGALRSGDTYPVVWDGRRYDATLKALLPEIDPVSRTLTAVFSLGDSVVPLGAVVELELETEVAASGFWVPLTALTESDRGLWGVFVVNSASTVERRLVEIIHTEASRAYVRGTLSSGDLVVSTGVQRIVPGQQVTAVMQGD